MSFSLIGQQDSMVYRLDLKKELTIAGSSVALMGSSLLMNHFVDDLTIEELEYFSPEDVNSFDRPAINKYNVSSAQASDYFKTGAFYLPALALATQNGRNEWKHLVVMYMEVMVVNASLTEFNKNLFRRKRPFVYNESLLPENRIGNEAKRSFYSGHVSHVSGMSYFTAKILTDLYPEFRYKWAFWTGATIIPATCAYLRVDGGRHFNTDVIAGLVAGGLVGMLIPTLHKYDGDFLAYSVVPAFGRLALSVDVNLNKEKNRQEQKVDEFY